jgi:hypothetical protein
MAHISGAHERVCPNVTRVCHLIYAFDLFSAPHAVSEKVTVTQHSHVGMGWTESLPNLCHQGHIALQ